jgi:RNA polymerase sigma factor (sigma-70 family)
MLNPQQISTSHEVIFVERYDRLLSWSLQLTDRDRDLAEDLLHDAFVQFTLAHPDLKSIDNLDGYLYGALRNLRLLQLRRQARNRLQQLSVVEYDSAADGLRTIDPRDQQHVQDELRRVCHYACARKGSARAASILILRFFHGYYPSEISLVTRSSRQALDVRLLFARREAKTYLENPSALAFLNGIKPVDVFPSSFIKGSDDFLDELRETIFRSRTGRCFSQEEFRAFDRSTEPLSDMQLAHLVSCRQCLDEVNRRLGLALLSDRVPTEMLGRDKRGKGGPGQGSSGPSGGGEVRRALYSLRGRARRVFEHRPQELRVSVNGYVQGSQRVNSEVSELNLNLNLPEPITCIEVFSEQQVRLLLLTVDGLPPVGPGEQSTEVELSEGRTVGLNLRFNSAWPTLQVLYKDPTFKDVEALLFDPDAMEPTAESVTPGPSPVRPSVTPESALTRLRSRAGAPMRILARFGFWFRPSAVTVLLAAMLIAVLMLLRTSSVAPGAVELVHRSLVAEDALVSRADIVLHRTINFEERGSDSSSREALPRRIEIWQNSEKGITARRLIDEKGYLIAGQWTNSDGSRTLYSHGNKPRTIDQAQVREEALLARENLWLLEPSAKSFSALVGDKALRRARVEELPNAYSITCEVANKQEVEAEGEARGMPLMIAPPASLITGTIVLSKPDLHATELTLIVRDEIGPGLSAPRYREYHYVEASFERHAPNTVAPKMFEPERELLSSAPIENRNSKLQLADSSSVRPSAAAVPVVATAELEVEVLDLLSLAGADLDEQTTVTRTADGKLRVGGLVDTARRKEEIRRALGPLTNSPAVVFSVETVAEAVQRQQHNARQGSPGVVAVEQIQVTKTTIPFYAELHGHFANDEAVGRFAARMVNRSSEAMSQAAALKRLLKQFSREDLRTLTPDARTKWMGMIRAHARSFERDTATLYQELRVIFPLPAVEDRRATNEIADDIALEKAVELLYGLSAANDQAVRSAFTSSTAAEGGSAAIKSPDFWRSLKGAQALAASIARVNSPGNDR